MSAWIPRAAAALALVSVGACTTVSADVRRRDVVVAVERIAPLPLGVRIDDAEAIHVVTPAETIVAADACARVEGRELVVIQGDAQVWRGPLAAVSALEVRRVHQRDARVRADADDAASAVLAVIALGLGGLVAVFSIAMQSH